MAEQSSKSSLRYTGLSYEDIKSQIDSALRGDSRFENFVDSALYKIMLNLCGKSILWHVIERCKKSNVDEIMDGVAAGAYTDLELVGKGIEVKSASLNTILGKMVERKELARFGNPRTYLYQQL